LAKGCEQRGFTVDIVITNARTPRVFESVEAKDRGGLAEYRNAYIRRMQAATAENAIPAVTCLHRRTGRSFGRADVSIFDRLRDGVARRVIAAWHFRYAIRHRVRFIRALSRVSRSSTPSPTRSTLPTPTTSTWRQPGRDLQKNATS
jgi:hypothetical protein